MKDTNDEIVFVSRVEEIPEEVVSVSDERWIKHILRS